jgi:hypothetical protein
LGVGGNGEEMRWEDTDGGGWFREEAGVRGEDASQRSSTGKMMRGRASSGSFPHGASGIYSVAFGGNFRLSGRDIWAWDLCKAKSKVKAPPDVLRGHSASLFDWALAYKHGKPA